MALGTAYIIWELAMLDVVVRNVDGMLRFLGIVMISSIVISVSWNPVKEAVKKKSATPHIPSPAEIASEVWKEKPRDQSNAQSFPPRGAKPAQDSIPAQSRAPEHPKQPSTKGPSVDAKDNATTKPSSGDTFQGNIAEGGGMSIGNAEGAKIEDNIALNGPGISIGNAKDATIRHNMVSRGGASGNYGFPYPVKVGQTGDGYVPITWDYSGPDVFIDSIRIVGDNADDFLICEHCEEKPPNLTKGTKVTSGTTWQVSIRFRPLSPGNKKARLRVKFSGPKVLPQVKENEFTGTAVPAN